MKREQFKDFLLSLQKPLITTIETSTSLEMLKKSRESGEPNPYLGKVVRRALRHGILNANYENMVNAQRGRETPVGQYMTEFKAESLWNGAGEHIGENKVLVRHRLKGTEYLVLLPKAEAIEVEKNESETFGEFRPIVYNDRYFHIQDGRGKSEEINKDILKPYLKTSGNSDKQETEKPIFYRTIELRNVVGIKYKSELIPIED